MAWIRSVSLTRSSWASRTVVVPSAKAGGDGQDGNLVDGSDDEVAGDFGGPELRGAGDEISNRLAPRGAAVLHGNVGVHGLQDVEHAGARGVDADVEHSDVGIGVAHGGDEPEGGAADVARGHDIDGPQVGGMDGEDQAVFVDAGAHGPQHQLGVVAGQGGLADGGGAIGGQTG